MNAPAAPKGTQRITLRLDTSATDGLFETALDAPFELVDGAFDLPDELFTIDVDCCSAAAGEVVVRLQPSEALLGFLAASRAGNGNSGVLVHQSNPADVCNTSMTEAGGANNPAGGGAPLSSEVRP